nr:Aln5 alnumycin cyclase [uncultured bacterium]
MLSEKDLIGAWRLVSLYYRDEDGSTGEGPLGPAVDGLLIYGEHGYMGVGMMRVGDRPGADHRPGYPEDCYLGYSGRWRSEGDVVVHDVAIGSHPRVVGTEQVRDVRLDGDRLVLSRPVAGASRRIVMEWLRVAGRP